MNTRTLERGAIRRDNETTERKSPSVYYYTLYARHESPKRYWCSVVRDQLNGYVSYIGAVDLLGKVVFVNMLPT